MDSEIHTKWKLPPVQIPKSPPTAEFPSRLVWRYPDGKLLEEIPEVDEQAVRGAITAGPVPSAPTRIELDHRGDWTRVLVRRSCGNRGLDMLVVSALRKILFPRECRSKYLGARKPPSYCPEAGNSSTLEVEWRLLDRAQEPNS